MTWPSETCQHCEAEQTYLVRDYPLMQVVKYACGSREYKDQMGRGVVHQNRALMCLQENETLEDARGCPCCKFPLDKLLERGERSRKRKNSPSDDAEELFLDF